VRVAIPATSANLGPGFDCLGLAVDQYCKVDVRVVSSGLRITAGGAEGGDIPTGAGNRVYRGMKAVFDRAGEATPGLEVHINNAIPVSRGLGSSAAAAGAGLMAANALLGSPFSKHDLLSIGLPIEGHPDNLAPALFGGLRVSSVVGDKQAISM